MVKSLAFHKYLPFFFRHACLANIFHSIKKKKMAPEVAAIGELNKCEKRFE